VRRFALTLAAVAGLAAIAPAGAALADPPQPPPGCAVVIGTPAATTGSAQGMANKMATFERLCVQGGSGSGD
jgi:hypothetical protein